MLVYRVTNTKNGKVYIGKTETTLEKRWKKHLSHRKDNNYFHRALRKHSAGVFIIEVLHQAKTREELRKMETFFIILHQSHLKENGYNLTLGGEGVSIPRTDEWRRKIGDALRGKKKIFTDEHCFNISLAKRGKGHLHSEITKLKMSQTRKGKAGRSQSNESRLKISKNRRGITAWNKGKRLSIAHRQHLSAAQQRRWSNNG